MASLDECKYCPNTKWCTQGVVQGICDAGFWCDFGATDARDSSKQCEIGHYCLAGTEYPTRCPKYKYSAVVQATSPSFCSQCEAGYYCIPNDSVMRICPKGHICPEGVTAPIACYRSTYNPDTGKSASEDCLPCPKGYYCNDRGIEDYNRYECPVGHYCDREKLRRKPQPCKPGTYRNATAAVDSGVYLNYLDRKIGNSTWTNWVPEGRGEMCWNCTNGTYCPEGSVYPTPCEAGYTCPNYTG
jgi:hypothetical protein